MPNFTEEQVTQLAPDANSLKAGRELANERKWTGGLFYNHRVLWGAVQGSGSQPYRTQVDLGSSGFACSCPSRKFPCKHGLGLMLLYARRSDLFVQSAIEPEWVQQWMDGREKRVVQQREATTKHPDEKATKSKKKTEAIRNEQVNAGVAELELMLRDLVRGGLIEVPNKSARFFEQAAARMVDQKAPGLARWMLEFNQLGYTNPTIWHEEVLVLVSRIWALLQAYHQIQKLPPLMQHDVRTQIGWGQSQADLLEDENADIVEDDWVVCTRLIRVEDKVSILRYYLWGATTGRRAMIQDSFAKGRAAGIVLVPGSIVRTPLVFFPSQRPFRAILKVRGENRQQLEKKPMSFANFEVAHRAFVDDITQYPWRQNSLQLIDNVLLSFDGIQWMLTDEHHQMMPIHKDLNELGRFTLLAVTGGNPCTMAVLRDRNSLLPLGTLDLSSGYKPIHFNDIIA